MSTERLQILKMVAAGKLSAEEASQLLDALEQEPKKPAGHKVSHVRIHMVDGRKASNFSVGVGLARWVLTQPVFQVRIGAASIDPAQLLQLIDAGTTGKVMELTEDGKRLEIHLDP